MPVDLMLCDNGHVTDPDADVDMRTGEYVTAQVARDIARVTAAGNTFMSGMIEKGARAWRQVCRRSTQRAGGSWHQCRAHVTFLDSDPPLASAYAIGGEEAVREMLKELRGRQR